MASNSVKIAQLISPMKVILFSYMWHGVAVYLITMWPTPREASGPSQWRVKAGFRLTFRLHVTIVGAASR